MVSGVGEEVLVAHATKSGLGGDRDDIEGLFGEAVGDAWGVHLVEQQFHFSSSSRWRRHDASASSAMRERSAISSSISSV